MKFVPFYMDFEMIKWLELKMRRVWNPRLDVSLQSVHLHAPNVGRTERALITCRDRVSNMICFLAMHSVLDRICLH
jgi:hypothetical protein